MNARTTPSLEALPRILGRARQMWAIVAGGRIHGEGQIDPQGVATLRVFRPDSPSPAQYPSLVDPSLVWLTLEVVAPSETIATMTWGTGGVQVEMSATLPAAARPGFEEVARRIAFEAALVEPPRSGHMDVGRGAWEQAGVAAEPRLCGTCPFARASNLDCPECRSVVMERKTFSQWSRARVAEGLRALDFDPDLASRVALEVEFILAQIQAPMLSQAYFDEWSLRFAAATRELFDVEEDREIARDMIEAQMVQPWFRLPPLAERPRPRPLPPVFAEATLGSAARRKVRELVDAGASLWQAERRVEASLTLRQLLAAEGELLVQRFGGGVAVVRGDLDRLLLTIGAEGDEPWIVEVATPLGRTVEFARGLDEAERARLQRELEQTHRRLVEAVAQERRAMEEPEDARAITLALENLRGERRGNGDAS